MSNAISIHKIIGLRDGFQIMVDAVDVMILEHETNTKIYDIDYLYGQKTAYENSVQSLTSIIKGVNNEHIN